MACKHEDLSLRPSNNVKGGCNGACLQPYYCGGRDKRIMGIASSQSNQISKFQVQRERLQVLKTIIWRVIEEDYWIPDVNVKLP